MSWALCSGLDLPRKPLCCQHSRPSWTLRPHLVKQCVSSGHSSPARLRAPITALALAFPFQLPFLLYILE